MRPIRVVTVLVLAALSTLAACKGVDQRLTTLTYRPSAAAPATTGAPVAIAMPTESHGLPRNPGGEAIIADITTKSGSRRAGVVSVEPIAPWVGHALEGELRAAGVNAALDLDPKPGRPVIKTEVARLHNDTRSQWQTVAVTSTITLAFTVEKDGQKLGDLEVTGEGKADHAGEYKDLTHEAMQKALRDALLKAVPRLKDLTRA